VALAGVPELELWLLELVASLPALVREMFLGNTGVYCTSVLYGTWISLGLSILTACRGGGVVGGRRGWSCHCGKMHEAI
jgi:hypothetical protein